MSNHRKDQLTSLVNFSRRVRRLATARDPRCAQRIEELSCLLFECKEVGVLKLGHCTTDMTKAFFFTADRREGLDFWILGVNATTR
mmetsp:Transcript_16405/g.62317  ORF Transcript_16405/g.62317 Transcript_16405/m.62317 type:complete len:86 (-) Transcript_16405:464-721(-)